MRSRRKPREVLTASMMNAGSFETRLNQIIAGLLAEGYTREDLDWLLAHGWDPTQPDNLRRLR